MDEHRAQPVKLSEMGEIPTGLSLDREEKSFSREHLENVPLNSPEKKNHDSHAFSLKLPSFEVASLGMDPLMSFAIGLLAFQLVIAILFGIFVEYSHEFEDFSLVYNLYRDVNVMIFLGFGFLMTFPKTYSFFGVALNFLLAAVIIQWAILVRGFLHLWWDGVDGNISLGIHELIEASFSAGAMLITFGVILGRTTPSQLLFIAFFETIFGVINEFIIFQEFKATDTGGSMVLHLFGALFGLAVSSVLLPPRTSLAPSSSKNTALFCLLGTLFLWIYWPSFNVALTAPDSPAALRVVVNTIVAITSSCITTFFISIFCSSRSTTMGRMVRLEMEHIQNATLAGGVAIGSVCALATGVIGSSFIGVLAGTLSTLGYLFLTPSMSIPDTCGVTNLHGIPGLIGGLASVISAKVGFISSYVEGEDISALWAGRADGFSPSKQALMQFLSVVVTCLISISSGLLCGVILRYFFKSPQVGFSDEEYFHLDHLVAETFGSNVQHQSPVIPEKKASVLQDVEMQSVLNDSHHGLEA